MRCALGYQLGIKKKGKIMNSTSVFFSLVAGATTCSPHMLMEDVEFMREAIDLSKQGLSVTELADEMIHWCELNY